MTEKSDWLAGLEEGDPVLVRTSHIGDDFGRLGKIVRITPKQFVTERGSRYRRTDGERIGLSGSYHSTWIEEPTTERKVAIAMDRKRSELRSKISQVCWRDQSLATLEAVAELVAKAGKAGG
jgi:hypothetical protein